MSDFEEERRAIELLTSTNVEKLTIIWKQIFHPDICKENLRKLIDHVTYFYQELVEETLSRKKFIENEINELKKEADNLKRLLNTDVKLPSYVNNELPLLLVQSELDKSLEGLREQLRLRKEQICELLLEQENLCDELGETPRDLKVDPLPTDEEIETFKKHLEALRTEKLERMHLISTMRKEIKENLQLLELKVNTEDEDRILNKSEIKLHKKTIEALKHMQDLYGSQVTELKKNIQCMRKKLDILWSRLQTSPNTRNNFNRYNEYNQHTYDLLYSELQRCETLKSLNIKHFILQVREDIEKMWEKTLKSEEEKNRFSSFNSTSYTDDMLTLHELELEDLKSYYETNKQIFELYADRNILWDRMKALEAKASDPGRYNNRGGQLLKEEKERKTITTKLPKIEQKICELVKEYEGREHTPFLIYGENIIDVMRAQWAQRQHEKELSQSARKNASTKLNSVTKTNSTKRMPLSVHNTSSLSCQKLTPSSISLLSNATSTEKRQLNSNGLHTPVMKRSLIGALNSPSVFQNPSASETNVEPPSNNKKSNKSSSNLKSPSKKSKLIATTIRHHNGRHGGTIKRRRSSNKTPAPKVVPKIVVDNCQSDGYSTDSNSEVNCVKSNSLSPSHQNRMKNNVNDENKFAKLPNSEAVYRTPLKQVVSHLNLPLTFTKKISPNICNKIVHKLPTKKSPIP